MRHSISMILLSAGIVLSLAGCQKDPSSQMSGKAVRFSASSASAETRTSFSGDGTQDGTKTDEFGRKLLTWERIDWKVGDQVMIASDYATVYQTPSKKFATYKVEKVYANGKVSDARVEEMDGDQELFFTDASSYTFWGIYPANVGNGATLETGKANFAISNPPTPTVKETITKDGKTLTVLEPDMTQAVMLAEEDNVTNEEVDLKFYPAFTAFEFTLSSKEASDLRVKELVLSSSESALAGSVVATIEAGETTDGKGNSTYAITPSDNGGKLTYTFPANTAVSNTKYLTFTVFALPQDIKGLTMEFHLGADGSNVQRGTLKYNGEDITFSGCKKYCLRGIAVKSGWDFKILNLKGVPDDWTDVELEIDNAVHPEATQFEVSGANNGRYYSTADLTERDRDVKADRQKWLMKNDGSITTVKFKVMSPDGWDWLVVPEGDVDAYTITTNMTDNALTGPVSNTKTVDGQTVSTTTTVILYIKAKDTTDTAAHTLNFKTYVVDPDSGSKYSLDSETQLLEARGYHYFLLNTTL